MPNNILNKIYISYQSLVSIFYNNVEYELYSNLSTSITCRIL